MGKLKTLQKAWRGHGPRPTDLMLVKAVTVASLQAGMGFDDLPQKR